MVLKQPKGVWQLFQASPFWRLTTLQRNWPGACWMRGLSRHREPRTRCIFPLATVHGMDFLLTWNFRHINNAEMKARIRTIIEAAGFEFPVIVRRYRVVKSDPIVDEVRKVREAHAAKFNYDLSAICADLKKKEKDSGHPVVSRRPKLRLKPTGS